MSENWTDHTYEVDLGKPGHGGFVVARHEGRVLFVRHGLPGERARVRVTEDRGGSFVRADAVEILDPSPHRIDPLCPISGPGGAGCCDFSHSSLEFQREMKSGIVAEQLRRIAGIERDVQVENLPETGDGTGWRSRVRLAIDEEGQPGYHRYRSHGIVTDLRCPQIDLDAYAGLSSPSEIAASGRKFTPGSELQIVLDADGARHIVEIAPAKVSRTGRVSPGRRGATARRAAGSAARRETVVAGTGRAIERVGSR
ncbi:MAG: TRAM domain-containing protein, partial [Rhodococcus sp.]|nr:TRAM domain-containing protein [Rhodococcus sp. (in: high G+C Gram-positive bacteria)]